MRVRGVYSVNGGVGPHTVQQHDAQRHSPVLKSAWGRCKRAKSTETALSSAIRFAFFGCGLPRYVPFSVIAAHGNGHSFNSDTLIVCTTERIECEPVPIAIDEAAGFEASRPRMPCRSLHRSARSASLRRCRRRRLTLTSKSPSRSTPDIRDASEQPRVAGRETPRSSGTASDHGAIVIEGHVRISR